MAASSNETCWKGNSLANRKLKATMESERKLLKL